ncbi:MAG: hypothetical protein ABSH20_19055 [Tepidisphaeraceae bacterium]|jgi:hypothetical protein
MKRYHWLSAAACLLAGLIWGLPRPGQSRPAEWRIIARIEIPPGDGLETLQRVAQATGLTLHVGPTHRIWLDYQAFNRPIVLRDVTAEAAVRAVSSVVELAPYSIVDGRIHISDCCEKCPHVSSRLYDVGYLLDAADGFARRCQACEQYVPSLVSPNSTLVGVASANGSSASGRRGGGGLGSGRLPTREDSLVQFIVQVAVTTDSDGSESACIVGRRLVLTCSPASHQRVQQVLGELAASVHNKEPRP